MTEVVTPEVDIFAGAKEIKPGKFNFGKVGDYIVGYFHSVKEVDTDSGRARIYNIKACSGQYHNTDTSFDANGNKVVTVDEAVTKLDENVLYPVWGKAVDKAGQIDDFLKVVKLNQKVAIQLKEFKPSKKKGYSPLKIYKTMAWPEFDPESEESLVETAGL